MSKLTLSPKLSGWPPKTVSEPLNPKVKGSTSVIFLVSDYAFFVPTGDLAFLNKSVANPFIGSTV